MSRLLRDGEIDPARKKWFWGAKEPNLSEEYFSAYGWRFKAISYYKWLKSNKYNKRLNLIYWSRDAYLNQQSNWESIFSSSKS